MHSQDRTRFPPTTATLKDGQQVTLRLLAPEDAQALSDFYAVQPRATYRFYCPHPLTDEQAARKAAEALAPNDVTVVAQEAAGSQIVGYAWYRWKDSDSKKSWMGICVRPTHRGLALGQALLERLIAIAAHVGPPVMSLTVQKANPRALTLYKKMGFHVVREQMRGQVEEFAPEPEYYMERAVR